MSEQEGSDRRWWMASLGRSPQARLDDPSFQPMVFGNLEEGEPAIVAELVEVLL